MVSPSLRPAYDWPCLGTAALTADAVTKGVLKVVTSGNAMMTTGTCHKGGGPRR